MIKQKKIAIMNKLKYASLYIMIIKFFFLTNAYFFFLN
jgi:hypothetical protein